MRGGLDEVGMGAIAGPVVVAVTVFPTNLAPIKGVDDSKRVSSKRRISLVPVIMEQAVYVGMGWAGPRMVDKDGIAEAWQFAAKQALARIPPRTHLIVDGIRRPIHLPSNWEGSLSVEKKADSNHWEVAAASIVAKVVRDLDMKDMASRFPEYGWGKNAGYGTGPHCDQLKTLGPSPYHRMTFLKNMVKRGELPIPTRVGVG